MESKTCFLVSYNDPKEKKVVSLKVGTVTDSNLGLSFVKLSEFLFEDQGLVVDPEQERLQKRYEDVKSLHISIYSILSITEVGFKNEGLKFKTNKSNLLVLNGQSDSTEPKH